MGYTERLSVWFREGCGILETHTSTNWGSPFSGPANCSQLESESHLAELLFQENTEM